MVGCRKLWGPFNLIYCYITKQNVPGNYKKTCQDMCVIGGENFNPVSSKHLKGVLPTVWPGHNFSVTLVAGKIV